MYLKWSLALTMSWLLLLYLAGIHIFTTGFLLRRMEMINKSHCSHDFQFNTDMKNRYHLKDQMACIPAQYRRAIFVVIDALRFDFVKYDATLSHQSFYKNKLKILHEMITTRANQSRLYQFMADPPTTTMQRIKGLTTGSLPTFIDAGSNFESSQITEDNFIHKLRKANKTMVFMGDDTWEGLYPNVFDRSHPYPSFNVKDLHTVDNGVLHHLMPELHGGDWDILIAHFLGVDHCGHTYGPNHQEMTNKLTQMDKILRQIIDVVDNDTVLFIMGDHGMTRTGDHGGDSDDEISAALFIYSGRPITTLKPVKEWKTVSQADFVPTVSLLLGLPIPFANLGLVIDELFEISNNSNINMYHRIELLRMNAWQVNTYLKTYSNLADDFLGPVALQLQQDYTSLEADYWNNLNHHPTTSLSDQQLMNISQAYRNYLKNVREICAGVWAKFDMITICFGLLILIMAIISTLMVLRRHRKCLHSVDAQVEIDDTIHWNIKLAYGVGLAAFITFIIIAYFSSLLHIPYILSIIVFASTLASVVSCFYTHQDNINNRIYIIPVNLLYPGNCEGVVIMSCYVFHLLSYFSNSFVITEDSITRYLVQTCVLIYAFKLIKNSAMIHKRDKDTTRLSGKCLLAVAWMSCNRFATIFYSCREEQYWCTASTLLNSPSGIAWSYKCFSFTSVLLVPVIIIALIYRYKFNVTTFGKLLIWGTPICSICIVSNWLMLSLPESTLKSLLPWQHVILPRMVYAITAILLIVLFSKSTMKKIAKINVDQSLQLSGFEIVIKLLLLVLSFPFMMLLGCGLAPSLLFCLFSIASFLVLSHYCRILSIKSNAGSLMPCWTQVLTWEIICSQSYFVTGHQNTVITIRWSAAFTGLHGDSNSYVMLGLLVVLNTFAAQIIFGLSITFLMPMIQSPELWNKYHKNKDRKLISYNTAFEIVIYFFLFCGIKVFTAAVAATLLRRHLMAWKIFAPRLLFEAASFLVTSISAFIGYLITYRFIDIFNVSNKSSTAS